MDMNEREGKEAFGALAHEHRLQIYRFLMQKYPEGASSGDIAEVPRTTGFDDVQPFTAVGTCLSAEILAR